MDVTEIPMWTVTITYRDGTSKVFFAQDLDGFHYQMGPNVTNEAGSPMYSVLIH